MREHSANISDFGIFQVVLILCLGTQRIIGLETNFFINLKEVTKSLRFSGFVKQNKTNETVLTTYDKCISEVGYLGHLQQVG